MHMTFSRRWRAPARSMIAALAVVLAAVPAVLSPTAARAAAATDGTVASGPVARPLAKAVCGTWVLYQVSSRAELDRLAPQIKDALALPGVVGLSVRFPWDAVDLTGDRRSHPVLRKSLRLAKSQDKALSVRFMAGAHTPDRVFDAGAAYYLTDGGARVPLPWDNATGDHQVFLNAYERYATRLARWSKGHGVRLLHLSWYGQDWAELNHGAEVRAAPGYTERRWLRGHRQLVRVGGNLASRRLAVELPLSGYGPLSGGQSAALARTVRRVAGDNSSRFFVQANGWGPNGEWGAPSQEVEQQFDAIWKQPVRRGLQMIQPDGYDWDKVFARLDRVGATYAEVYLPSFWQVPGPSAQYDHNTEAKIADLEHEIQAFAKRTC